MSASEGRRQEANSDARVAGIDVKLEVVVIPVSDADRAKEFYGRLGWRLDADFRFDNGFRVIQFTPPGSECSVQFGTHITSAGPGSAQGLYLVVSDIEAARNELVTRGVEVSDVFHAGTPGAQFQPRAYPVASPDQHQITPPTAPTPRSATRTATAGCCRRSQPGLPGASTLLRLHMAQQATWRARFGVRRPPTASMRSASTRRIRTGRTGTRST